MQRARRLVRDAVAALVLVASAVVPIVGARAAAWAPNPDDQLLLDVHDGQYRLGNGVRGYNVPGGTCVDLADMVMALDLPVRVDPKSRRATGWLFSESRTFTLDRDSGTVQIMNKMERLQPTDIRDTPEGWCVATSVLARWLGVQLTVDRGNALIVVKSATKLPFELAEERKERAARIRPAATFDLRSLPAAPTPYRLWRTPSVDVNVTIAALHDATQHVNNIQRQYELYASGEVARASFDARVTSDNDGVPNSLRLRVYRTDPNGRLLGPVHATHVGVGDVTLPSSAVAMQSVIGRGAYVTNRPVDRPDNFDKTSFHGDLPNGWDAELYRNGQLIAVAADKGTGRYDFVDVPLLYGQNSFEIVLYGPQGQIRRETKLVPVGLDSIPPRQTYWWAGVADANHDLINLSNLTTTPQLGWRGGFGVERGIDDRSSVAATLVNLMVQGVRHSYIEASARRAIGPGLFELSDTSDLTGGNAIRGQFLAQLGATNVAIETIWGSGGFQSDRFINNINGFHSLSLDHDFRLAGATVPVHVESTLTTYADGHRQFRTDGRLSFALRRVAITTEVAWVHQDSALAGLSSDEIDNVVYASGRIGRVRLRGQLTTRLAPDPALTQSDLIAEWNAGTRTDWRAEVGYDATLSRARAAIGLTRRFDRFALTGSAELGSDGSVGASLGLVFSLGPDPAGHGVRMAANPLASGGEAMVTVFKDLNGDGIREPGEPVVAGADVTAGLGRVTTTDRRGHAFVTGLDPFRPVLIGVDAGSLSDPYMQPRTAGLVVTPRPGVATRVDIPLVASGTIEGNLQREGGAPLAGVAVELIDAAGHVQRTTRSEFDGYFLFEGVPYGHYRLRIGAASASVLRLATALAKDAVLSAASPSRNLGAVVASAAPVIAAGN